MAGGGRAYAGMQYGIILFGLGHGSKRDSVSCGDTQAACSDAEIRWLAGTLQSCRNEHLPMRRLSSSTSVGS